ncbi:hypothetical protein [Chondromyces crocatus]|uniref:HTTM domain-containing protein n=1 Tax=Chondromyces crocatus TaxID=52 RepID=A0A0K1ET11_CHOCO|nr:hypothetical protein [Chondromyces crocatus]AKT43782.1 uncharacterized protein CMC5_080180 [Chondromyces crocatus]
MSASPYQGASRAPLRVSLAVVAALDAIVLGGTVAKGQALSEEVPRVWRWLSGSPLAAWGVAVVALGALAAFARRWRPLVSGAVALGALACLVATVEHITGGARRSFYLSGAMLLGWLVGLAYARSLGHGDTPMGRTASARSPAEIRPHTGEPRGRRIWPEEILAEAGATAALAATYVNGASSKLLSGGVEWADGVALRSLVVTSTFHASGEGWLDAYKRVVVEQPVLAQGLAGAALLIQLGSASMLVDRRLRVLWGTLLLGFHANVLLLTGIHYGSAMLLLLVWSYPWPGMISWVRRRLVEGRKSTPQRTEEGEKDPPFQDPPLVSTEPAARRRLHLVMAGSVVITLSAVGVASAWPESPTSKEASEEGEASDETLSQDLKVLGPFAVGDALTSGLHITRITRTEEGFEIELARAPEKVTVATLQLRPSAAGMDPGPFEAGTAELRYDRDARIPLEALLPAGKEVARRLKAAAGSAETAKLVEQWLSAP